MHGEELIIGGNATEAQRLIDAHNELARRMQAGNADAAMDPQEARPFLEEQERRVASDGLRLTLRRPRSNRTGERHYFA